MIKAAGRAGMCVQREDRGDRTQGRREEGRECWRGLRDEPRVGVVEVDGTRSGMECGREKVV